MFTLAATLGRSIREVERFDAAEIAEWMAYFQVNKNRSQQAELDRGALQAQASAARALKQGRLK